MKRYAFPIAVLAILGAFAIWWFSPVQVIKRRCGSLLETLTMEAGSGSSVRQMGAYSLGALLAQDVSLESPTIEQANGTFDRSEMESAYSWLCGQAKMTRFEMENTHSVKIDGNTAAVECTLVAVVELPTYRPVDGRYDVSFVWQQEDDGWRLSRADWDLAK